MNKLLIITILALVSFSCSETEDEKDVAIDAQNLEIFEPEEKNVVVADPKAPGEYNEYHPNGQLKINGINNEKGNRQGLWMSFYDNGIKWSESYYVDGKRDGHSITFYPNGKVRYVGEYKNDQQIGTWKFYDEEGVPTHEENYDK